MNKIFGGTNLSRGINKISIKIKIKIKIKTTIHMLKKINLCIILERDINIRWMTF